MRAFGGQVHVIELIAVLGLSFLTFLIGYSLPLMAMILLVFWPLLVIQMLFEGALIWVVNWFRKARPRAGPPRPPRVGLARWLWLAPLITLTLGYGWYVIDTGKWFI